jgi:hypothetical protein
VFLAELARRDRDHRSRLKEPRAQRYDRIDLSGTPRQHKHDAAATAVKSPATAL